MKIDEIRRKSDYELGQDLDKWKKDLFDLRFKSATQSIPNTMQVRALRRTIARATTILHERALAIRGAQSR
jgi:large subunit ribosomal protein L29